MKRRRRLGSLLTALGNLAVLVLVCLLVAVAFLDPSGDSVARGASQLLRNAFDPLQPVGHALGLASRWTIKNAAWLGDIATWLTGLFTFAAFYVAWRVFRQARHSAQRAQADQVAVWTHLEPTTTADTEPMPDGYIAIRNLRAAYTVHVANQSAAAILGLKLEIRPYSEKEAKQANRRGPTYFKHNVLAWLDDAVISDGAGWHSARLGPWLLPPGEVVSTEVVLRVDLAYCDARMYFWDAHSAKWAKDIRTGELAALNEPLGLVDGDESVRTLGTSAVHDSVAAEGKASDGPSKPGQG